MSLNSGEVPVEVTFFLAPKIEYDRPKPTEEPAVEEPKVEEAPPQQEPQQEEPRIEPVAEPAVEEAPREEPHVSYAVPMGRGQFLPVGGRA